MGIITAVDFWTDAMALAAALSRTSYLELLGIDALEIADPNKPTALTDAYHASLRRYHPDRHALGSTSEQKEALARICARIGEAYRVLSKQSSRESYLADLEDGGHQRAKRATKSALVETRDPKSEKARVLLESAIALRNGGNDAAARAKLDLALQFEPDSRALKEAREALRPEPQAGSEETA